MGKTKNKKRNKSRVPCPTGLSSVKEVEQTESLESEDLEELSLGDTRSAAVQDALEKLQSAEVEDKECGAHAVALLAEQKEALAEMLSLDLVKVAGPLLLDNSNIVRHSIAGALRNISVCGGHAASQIMIEQDILTPLVALLKQKYQDWSPVRTNNGKLDSLTEIFIEAIHLLWNLCESSATAISIFNREDLLPLLMNSLKPEVYDIAVVVAVAQCLHAVTEDNKYVLSMFNSQPAVAEQIKALLCLTEESIKHQLLRTVACGILLNIKAVCSFELSAVLLVLAKTLSCDVELLVNGFHNKIKSQSPRRRKNVPVDESVELAVCANSQRLNDVVQEISDLLLSKQLALEIITNICFPDDGDNWEEISSSGDSCDDHFNMQVDNNDQDCIDASTFMPNPLDVSCEVHEPLISLQIVDKVGQHLFLSDDFTEKLSEFKLRQNEILNKIRVVQCRALLCLNNLVSCLSIDDFGGTKQLYEIWLRIAQMVFKQAALEADTQLTKELLEAGTSALRAIIEKFAEFKAWHHFQGTTPKDLEMLFEVERMASRPSIADPSIRVNVIRVVSALGMLFANSNPGHLPASVEIQQLIKNISLFLLEVSCKDNEVWVTAEALDAIMDVFTEDPLDPLAREIGLVEKLVTILPNLKGKISQQKHSLGIHYSVVMTVRDNLTRFIKYKMKASKENTDVPQMTVSR